MLTTTNYGLKKPEGTDVVDIQNFNDNADIIDQALKKHDSSLSDMVYQIAGGSATAITLAIKGTLINGYPITFIASANNGGAVTTINGKKLYKPGTTISPNLISGKAYTVWYNSTGDSGNGCFFIKASAEGNALASDVRKSKIFSNDNDTGIVGGLDLSLLTSDNLRSGITIDGVTGKASIVDTADATVLANHILSPETAYKNGTKVTGTMVDRAGDTTCVSSSISGTTLKLKASEGYRDGINDNVTITDANFIASNIINGKNIFGLDGNALTHNYTTGTIPLDHSGLFYGTINLGFTPNVVILLHSVATTSFFTSTCDVYMPLLRGSCFKVTSGSPPTLTIMSETYSSVSLSNGKIDIITNGFNYGVYYNIWSNNHYLIYIAYKIIN
ncbi:hypothetical protein [Clostridium beijerinckii]|uniref:hypothetical protein n=1 Tax=Clostridium beijerinckii TaxID=1520 RepID=UPI001865863E|nr:hypothetical protein [Clostridium beijerinckii]